MMKTFRLLSLGLAILAAVAFPRHTVAQQTNWNTGNGSWQTSGNWGSGLPNASTDAIIGVGTSPSFSAVVTLDGSGTSLNLTMGQSDNSSPQLILSGTDSLTTVNQASIGATSNSTASATVTLSGNSTWDIGGITVIGGLNASGTVNIQDNAVVTNQFIVTLGSRNNNSNTGAVNLSGNGSWTINWTDGLSIGSTAGVGQLTLNGNSSVTSFGNVGMSTDTGSSASVVLNGGVFTVGNISEGLGNNGTITFNGGTLRLNRNEGSLFEFFDAGDVTFLSGGGTIDTQAFTVGTGQALAGSGALTKQGSGILTLSGANTYTGGTTVAAGDLRLTGSLAAGTVNVSSGGIFSGTGSAAGTVIVANGGAITPGNNGAGTLTVGGLTLNNSSILNYQLGTSSDCIQINGNLTLDGTLNVAALSGFGSGTYRLMDYTGTLTNNGLNFGVLPGGYDLTLDTATANQVNLISVLATSQFWDGANNTPNGTVDGGTGTWNAANTNWTNTGGNANSSWLGTLKAVFAGTAGTVTIEDGYTATAPALDFNVGGYTLAAAGTGNLSITGSTDFNTVTGTTTISAPITGSGNLSKVGAGTLVLSGANTYSGGTTISNGVLQIDDGGTTGSITGNVTNDASLAFNRSDAFSFGGDISGSGTLTQLGGGTTTLTGTNTYTGGTIVRSGTLAVTGTGSISHSAANLTVGLNSGDNATLQIGSGASVANDYTYLGYDGGSSGTAQISGGSWTHTRELYVGYTGNGTLEISGGTVSDTKAFIGVNSPSVSSATVSGGQWNNSGELTVGYGGAGSLAISGTGTVNSAGAYLGFLAASDGNSATITGADASWNSTGTFYLGYDGSNNSVTVSAGALLAGGNADFLIGSNDGSDSNTLTVTGSGSRFTDNGTLYIGRSGTGNQLEVLDGALVTSKNVRIGGGSGSVGTTTDNSATVDGTNSTWNISGTLRVGSNGDNTTLTVKNGGVVNVTGNSFVGYDAVSDNNLVKVTGAGSTLAVNALSIGRLGTNNTVSVETGGKLTATTITVAEQTGSSGSLLIGNGTGSGEVQAGNVVEGLGNGTVTFDGGTLKLSGNQASLFSGFEAGDVTLVNAGGTIDTNGFSVETSLGLAGNGRLTKQGSGSLTLSGTNSYTGGTTVRNGTLAVTGTVSHALADFYVGQSAGDNATLQLSGSGSVSNFNGFIGYDAGSTGLAKVGAGSWTNNGILYVGLSGDGTLELSGTGSVSDSTGYIGYSSGSTGLATVSGGSWTHSAGFTVGFSGDGTLELSGTGSVSNTDGYIAYYAGSTGLAQVSGGSWTNSGALYVGVSGDGTLELSGTGSVSNTTGYIGYSSGSTGLATVSGGSWTHSGGLAVGFSGNGTLELSGTGSVSNADGYISYNSGSAGLAQVSGGSWTNSGALYVGVYGDGTLELSGTGSVSNTIGYIGYDSISTSMVTVSGGSWTNSAVLAVGFSGDGTLGISGTGSVSNTIGYIGYNSGSTGLAQVTGGTWTQSAEFVVGYAGDGTLELSGTGSISDTVGYIGYFSGSTGLAQVSGGSWTHSAGFAVGFSGDGTLELSGSGSVSNTDGYIGYDAGSTGLAQVSAGSWTNSGALNVGRSGEGTLELSGTGSVSAGLVRVADQTGSVGAVKLLGGTLATGQVSKGSGTGTVTFNGGTLKLSGNQASLFGGFSDGDVTLTGPGGGTIDTQAFAVTTALGFAGNGPLTKTGTGSLNLTGNHTYTGATNINNGSLFVNGTLGNTAVTVANGGLLGGSGSIAGSVTVQSGGILAPGNSPGILTMDSLTLNAGSITRMQINGLVAGTEYDRLVVTNNANLNGSLALEFGFTPTVGDRFTLIQAGSYTLSGDAANGFAAITTTGLGATLKTTVEIDPTNFDILIDLRQADFAPFAGTPNQNAVAGALDEISRTGTIQDLIDYLNTLPAGDLPKAFEQLSPEELALLANTGFANTRGVFDMLQNRIQEIKNGQQFSGNGLTLWDDSRKFQQSLLASSGSSLVPGTEIYQPAARDDKRMGFFVSGQGVFGDVDGDGNGDAYDFTTGGMIVGADYRLTPNTAVGLYAGYQGSTSKTSASSEIKSDSAKVGVYGSWWHEKGSWLSANIGGGFHGYDTERVSVGGLAKGSSNGTEINGQLAVGHEFKAGSWTFGPEADLAYTRIWIDGFHESGSLAPLVIGDQQADSLRSTAAFKVSYDWQIEKLTLRPYGRIGWQHEFMDDNQAITARFAGGGGSVFTVQSPVTERDSIVAGAGVQALFSETISAWLGYNAEANADYEIHQINGSLNFRF